MTSRPGLYIAVGAILLGTCSIQESVNNMKINRQYELNRLEQQQNAILRNERELKESIQGLKRQVSELELSIEELKEIYQTTEGK